MLPSAQSRTPDAPSATRSSRRWRVVAAVAAMSAVAPGIAAAQDATWSVSAEEVARARNAPLFQSNDVLELTLSGPFKTIRDKDRGEEKPKRDATITFAGADGREITLPLKLETRGNFRLQKRNCDFPPLWLDFDKDLPDLNGTIFEGQNRLKLYVTCRRGRDSFEQYILQEYLVYPTYNLLTDVSFRARPVLVHYEDIEDPDESFTRHAFILEHKTQLAARNEAVPLETAQLHPGLPSQEAAALMEIFNYMIGMTDYSAVYMHNVEPIRRMDGKVVPVAYDFDWSGLVYTNYSRPDPSLEIRSVRQRVFQGFCRDVDYDAVFQRFLDEKEAILALWQGSELLEEGRREDAVEFLQDFFERIEDPGRRERITRDCRPIPG